MLQLSQRCTVQQTSNTKVCWIITRTEMSAPLGHHMFKAHQRFWRETSIKRQLYISSANSESYLIWAISSQTKLPLNPVFELSEDKSNQRYREEVTHAQTWIDTYVLSTSSHLLYVTQKVYAINNKWKSWLGTWYRRDHAPLEQRCKQPTRCSKIRLLIFLNQL